MPIVHKRGEPNYWAWRKSVGAKKKIESPEALLNLAFDYFASVDERPVLIQEQRKGTIRVDKDAATDPDLRSIIENPIIELKSARPYTWQGFEAYLSERGIVANLEDYRYNKEDRYTAYAPVIRAINNEMYAQKFEGAASGTMRWNIIALELGMTQKTQITLKDEQPLFRDEPSDRKEIDLGDLG